MTPTRWGLAAFGAALLIFSFAWYFGMPSFAPPTAPAPVPAFAEPGPFNGAFEVRIDNAVSSARRTLTDWGRLDAEIYRVPDGQTMPPIAAFYDGALDGWRRTPDANHAGARRPLVGWMRGDDRLAVLLVAGHPEDPWTFLVVLTPAAG